MVKKSLITKLFGIGLIAATITLYPSGSHEENNYFKQKEFLASVARAEEIMKEEIKKNMLTFAFDTGQYTPEQAITLLEKGIKKVGKIPSYMDVGYLSCLAKKESGWNPNAESPMGARGLLQIMPETWEEHNPGKSFNLAYNPNENIKTAIEAINANEEYFEKTHPSWNNLSKEKKLRIHAAAYNWGIKNVKRIGWDLGQKRRIPFETRSHVRTILEDYNLLLSQKI